MTTMDRNQLRPPYPVYQGSGVQPQPHTPPDLYPSGLGPGYSVYSSTFGRNLAGDKDVNSFDAENAEGIQNYPNELDALAVADDVQGNGVFDPNNTHGNIHPEDGVFNDHQSLPGYVARDGYYQLSEVRDLTYPGGNVVYVPGGAVSLQQGQQDTLTKNALFWKLPPGVSPVVPEGVPDLSTVDAPTATWPVGQTDSGEEKNYLPYYLAAGAVALGAAWLVFRKK